jgi:membrane dipeptidase
MVSEAVFRREPAEWAQSLGVSREAIDVYAASDVVDLHIDTFIWTRIFGYDLLKRHGTGLFNARFYGHADLPRLREARVTGGIWSITTNPLVVSAGRRAARFRRNLEKLRAIFERAPGEVAFVTNAAEYRRARAEDRHAAFIGIQGGNALDGDGALAPDLAAQIVKVTLVHLSNSSLGATSAPLGGDRGLSDAGREYVRRLNEARVFVDLAHINRRGFFDAVEAHDRTQPLLVSHTGIAGVHPHWRNIDDEQIRAVAATGGTIGVMYQQSFLGAPSSSVGASAIVDHLEHIVKVAGEDHAALGSDWDGAITTPRDLPTCLELPRLVQIMLDRGWSAERIGKILGGNFLRSLAALRG